MIHPYLTPEQLEKIGVTLSKEQQDGIFQAVADGIVELRKISPDKSDDEIFAEMKHIMKLLTGG